MVVDVTSKMRNMRKGLDIGNGVILVAILFTIIVGVVIFTVVTTVFKEGIPFAKQMVFIIQCILIGSTPAGVV